MEAFLQMYSMVFADHEHLTNFVNEKEIEHVISITKDRLNENYVLFYKAPPTKGVL